MMPMKAPSPLPQRIRSRPRQRQKRAHLCACHTRAAHLRNRRFGSRCKQQRRFGRRHPRRPALEQRTAKVRLQPRNRLRQRRLRQVHRPRSPRYAAVSYCRGKGGNVADVDRRFSHAATLSISLWEGANIALAGKDLPPHVFHQLKLKEPNMSGIVVQNIARADQPSSTASRMRRRHRPRSAGPHRPARQLHAPDLCRRAHCRHGRDDLRAAG
jgi:hypothetical protein